MYMQTQSSTLVLLRRCLYVTQLPGSIKNLTTHSLTPAEPGYALPLQIE